MDTRTIWQNLVHAISDVQTPGGDFELKLDTVRAGVEVLFECPAAEVLDEVERSSLPTRATVSWLIFEGGRLAGVDPAAVQALRELYEATCAPGQGIIPGPPAAAGFGGNA